MRRIDTIVVHCSATRPGSGVNAAVIDEWHRQRGWRGIGYHYVVLEDGTVERGRPVELVGAHCRGRNARSIGVCYVGGLDAAGRPADTRTPAQRKALAALIRELQQRFLIRKVMGHRDVSPDLNGNGRADPEEFIKACPCFDVREWVRRGMPVQ